MNTLLKFSGLNLFVELLNKIKNKELRSFLSFFLTAILGAGTNFFTRILYKPVFVSFGFADKPAFQLSIFAGYMTATIVTFIPNKVFAFSAKESGNTKRESVKFVIIAVVALGIQLGLSSLTFDFVANKYFTDYSLTLRETFSHIVGMGFSFLANFYGHKFLTFRSTGIYDKIKTRSTP
ncbi:GtrA family protein [Emticicia sp. SJ17W-69]|uniref:GtrA family protein n=1 Tax=Emticicia sp. SJ17W-69 TaxID=3421657 RepID=UPI003EB88CC4